MIKLQENCSPFKKTIMQYLVALSVVLLSVIKSRSCETNIMTFTYLAERIINAEYRFRIITARSKIECIRSLCTNRLNYCAVSYNSHNFLCTSAPVSGWIIAYSVDKFTNINENWTTYITKNSTDRPAVLYLLDSVSKGHNFGYKGNQINLIEDGLKKWDAKGPRGVQSHLSYLISDESNRAEIPFEKEKNTYYIDFSGPCTIAAWVKTDTSVVHNLPIILGNFKNYFPFFRFLPNQDQLRFAPNYNKHRYLSPVNDTGKQFWRHVAVVYRGFKDVHFYLNGSSFGQTIIEKEHDEINLPKRLYLGNDQNDDAFIGAMACVTIHESALTQAGVVALMSLCP